MFYVIDFANLTIKLKQCKKERSAKKKFRPMQQDLRRENWVCRHTHTYLISPKGKI